MAKPIIGLIPPTGWHYMDGDARIDSTSYDELVAAVEHYRAENHLPIGDVKGDIAAYICGNWPHFCHGVESVTVTSVTRPTRASELLDDIQTWARNILQSNRPVNYVTDDLAEQRARTCRACKMDFNWHSGCTSCIGAAKRLTANVRQGRDTPSSALLGGCLVQRFDNRAAIFLDRDEHIKAPGLPENCWLNI